MIPTDIWNNLDLIGPEYESDCLGRPEPNPALRYRMNGGWVSNENATIAELEMIICNAVDYARARKQERTFAPFKRPMVETVNDGTDEILIPFKVRLTMMPVTEDEHVTMMYRTLSLTVPKLSEYEKAEYEKAVSDQAGMVPRGANDDPE